MEGWMSGLNQQFTKLSAVYSAREFESRSLRQLELARDASVYNEFSTPEN